MTLESKIEFRPVSSVEKVFDFPTKTVVVTNCNPQNHESELLNTKSGEERSFPVEVKKAIEVSDRILVGDGLKFYDLDSGGLISQFPLPIDRRPLVHGGDQSEMLQSPLKNGFWPWSKKHLPENVFESSFDTVDGGIFKRADPKIVGYYDIISGEFIASMGILHQVGKEIVRSVGDVDAGVTFMHVFGRMRPVQLPFAPVYTHRVSLEGKLKLLAYPAKVDEIYDGITGELMWKSPLTLVGDPITEDQLILFKKANKSGLYAVNTQQHFSFQEHSEYFATCQRVNDRNLFATTDRTYYHFEQGSLRRIELPEDTRRVVYPYGNSAVVLGKGQQVCYDPFSGEQKGFPKKVSLHKVADEVLALDLEGTEAYFRGQRIKLPGKARAMVSDWEDLLWGNNFVYDPVKDKLYETGPNCHRWKNFLIGETEIRDLNTTEKVCNVPPHLKYWRSRGSLTFVDRNDKLYYLLFKT